MMVSRAPGRVLRGTALTVCAVVGAGCSGQPDRPALHRVTIRAMAYEPARLVVAAGDTVQWENRDMVPHTASASGGRWESGAILPNRSWRTVVKTTAVEPYMCRLHPTMKGEVDVR